MKVAIAGAGKLGTSLTRALSGGGNQITVIEKDPVVIQKIQNLFDVMAIEADARDSKILNELRINTYDCIISCTSNDEANIFICSLAKALGCNKAIARVRGPEHVAQTDLIKDNFSIDHIVNPDLSCATTMFRSLTEKYGLAGGKFKIGKSEVIEFEINRIPEIADKQIKEISSSLEGLLITAISRNGKIIIPNGSTTLLLDDHIFVTGSQASVAALQKKLKSAVKANKLRRVMIAGGGKTSYFLAKMLDDAGVSVKVIEIDKNRCNYLSEELGDVLILNGDASDPNLLEQENLSVMDAFVAATGFDEENILLAIIAQQHNVSDVIAKTSHNAYTSITDTMDDTMTISPIDMCTSAILRILTSGSAITFTKMVKGQAEFIEIIAEEGTVLTSDSLANITIPDGILITSVNRNGEIITPTGATTILPKDKVLILSMLSKASEVESLLAKGNYTL